MHRPSHSSEACLFKNMGVWLHFMFITIIFTNTHTQTIIKKYKPPCVIAPSKAAV